MGTKLDRFREFLTPELEREILEKLAFLRGFKFEGPVSVKFLREDRPYWQLTFRKDKLEVSASISVYTTTPIMSYGDKYFLFDHYLRFIKNDELSKIYADYFPNRFDMEASRQYCLDTLDLFAKHARLGLKPVLEGKTWIDVPNYFNEYR